MKKTKTFLAALLSVTVLFGGTAVSANAASAEVDITIKETTMDGVSVTVPTTLPVIFNEDGSNTIPENWTIENISSIAGIHLSQVDMDANGSGWTLLAESEDTKALPVNTKALKFYVGKDSALKMVVPTDGTEAETGRVTFADNEISVASGETQILRFGVDRGAFTADEAEAKAFDMVLTFNFN